jgi:hypothetical protein
MPYTWILSKGDSKVLNHYERLDIFDIYDKKSGVKKMQWYMPIVLLVFSSGVSAASSFDVTAPVENFAYFFSGEEMRLTLYVYDESGLKYSIERRDDPGTINSFEIVSNEWNITAYIDGKIMEIGPSKKVEFEIQPLSDEVISFNKDRQATYVHFLASEDDEDYKLHYRKYEEDA